MQQKYENYAIPLIDYSFLHFCHNYTYTLTTSFTQSMLSGFPHHEMNCIQQKLPRAEASRALNDEIQQLHLSHCLASAHSECQINRMLMLIESSMVQQLLLTSETQLCHILEKKNPQVSHIRLIKFNHKCFLFNYLLVCHSHCLSCDTVPMYKYTLHFYFVCSLIQ